MNTITAKELRDNLEDIAKKVSLGETFSVTYRNRPVFRIVREKTEKSHSASESFVSRVNTRKLKTGKPAFDPDKSIKELYHEMLDDDPKYK